MNCFHFSVSLGYKTTTVIVFWFDFLLWIAFIFQYLWDTKQLSSGSCKLFSSCELLSFFSIFGIQNNAYPEDVKAYTVVNCFHFSVSLGYKTTAFEKGCKSPELWIAFIFQYLWDTKQLNQWKIPLHSSCELLSFFSIFGIQNNAFKRQVMRFCVVNCFHFSVSLGYKTTDLVLIDALERLWIAFIFQYLWDTKQLGSS